MTIRAFVTPVHLAPPHFFRVIVPWGATTTSWRQREAESGRRHGATGKAWGANQIAGPHCDKRTHRAEFGCEQVKAIKFPRRWTIPYGLVHVPSLYFQQLTPP